MTTTKDMDDFINNNLTEMRKNFAVSLVDEFEAFCRAEYERCSLNE